ncbi:sigma-54-dependent Fis family transcriptional regulator [Zhengella mangrovi]|uniref:Sigma-54-dependent Fis family transcriptional regulator n=1 Tax=Zhengella mangrovi TaxID=1982044 RepID=A0A2G1QNR2_9HYPH|nr:sigma-54-dependent Fis family transcriptional regulator [Zhengella mangrovi]PHP67119.1 sigma-54-dependent Fis family transcriptional regulator [Zhengella mangrovi]
MVSNSAHVREIERVIVGGTSQRDDAVVRSWLRCVNDYKMDPASAQEAYIVPHEILREHRDQAEELISIGRSGLEALFKQVAEQHYVLLLSDARGVTVDFMGDLTFDNQLRKSGLYLGSEWSENRAGTCGVGACMVSGEPVIIHQDDHFDTCHIGLTCTAAPIYDTLGDLSAVLDISQLRSPTAKSSQYLALHLVTASARRIELANLLARTRNEWVLRLSRSPEFIDVDPEAAITLDGSGRITGMTHGSFSALARAMKFPLTGTRAYMGEPVSRFFEMDVEDLPRFMRGKPKGERMLRTPQGHVLFASAIAPVTRFNASPHPARTIPRALRGLGDGDARVAEIQRRAARLAARDIPILIQGETGSGKEHLARAIHDSGIGGGRFVAVNCAAIPESLIESELFGHAPHAFTGASPRGKAGLIEAADGGTLFLDEIGDMPLPLQARLLRVLAEGEVVPVGGVAPRKVRIRLISATHRDLRAMVDAGAFRADLFYRLNAATLTLPPLRERADFDRLVDGLLARVAAEHGDDVRLSTAARVALASHDWPGNIRELFNVLQVAVALADDGEITLDALPDSLPALVGRQAPAEAAETSLRQRLDALGGNVTALARQMGVNRSTIYRRLGRAR